MLLVIKLKTLLEKIKNRNFMICIIGLGRVGLPLAVVFATKGIQVIGIDLDDKRLESIKNSKCPFYDVKVQEKLNEANKLGTLKVYKKIDEMIENPDVIIVSVGTGLKMDNMMNYSQLYDALEDITSKDLKNKLIILRSTMPVGTTSDIVIPYLENKTSLKLGEDFTIAVCPERILEGHAIDEINDLPEIVGGINKRANELVEELFKIINSSKEFLFTSPSSAEMAKLFTNIYRYTSFALSNEFAIWAERYGLDAEEIIRIANHNYSRSNIPMPGFCGGPCLSKDGIFLDNNTTFASIVSIAWKMNESIPQHITNNLKKVVGTLVGKKISVLGLSFKAGSDDTRQSPSAKLVNILKAYGANVQVYDPHVNGTSTLSEVLENPEIVVLATNHKEFQNIVEDIKKSGCKLVYDVWSMYKNHDFGSIKYIRFGQGN